MCFAAEELTATTITTTTKPQNNDLDRSSPDTTSAPSSPVPTNSQSPPDSPPPPTSNNTNSNVNGTVEAQKDQSNTENTEPHSPQMSYENVPQPPVKQDSKRMEELYDIPVGESIFYNYHDFSQLVTYN